MKYLFKNNFDNKEKENVYKKVLDSLNAYSIKYKLNTFSYKTKVVVSDIDDLEQFNVVFIVLDSLKNIDKIKSFYRLYSEYRINDIVIFYNENIDKNNLSFFNEYALIKSYKNIEELAYFTINYLFLSSNNKTKYQYKIITKIISSKFFNINKKNISFINDLDYKCKLFSLYKKYIKGFLSNDELEFIENNLNGELDNKEDDSLILNSKKDEIEKKLLSEEVSWEDIEDVEYNEELFNKYELICKNRILIHKDYITYDRNKAYLFLAIDYYALSKFYNKINDLDSFYYYQNIAYQYTKANFRIDNKYIIYLALYLRIVFLHFDCSNIDYIKLITDLNNINIMKIKFDTLDNLHEMNIITTIYAVLSYCYYMINEFDESSYYLDKAKESMIFNLPINDPFEAIFKCGSFLNNAGTVFPIKLTEIYLNHLLDEFEQNNKEITEIYMTLAEFYLKEKNYKKVLSLIDKGNYYFDKIEHLEPIKEVLIPAKFSIMTVNALYNLNGKQEDIDFHLNIIKNSFDKCINDDKKEEFILCLYNDLEFLSKYYKVAKNKEFIKPMLDEFKDIFDFIDLQNNDKNESSFS